MVDFNIKKITITLNRNCNLRCSWCYAQDTGFNSNFNMKIETVEKIIKFAKSCGVKKISLIGGEPFIYKDLKQVLKLLNGFDVSIVTNGIYLSDLKNAKEICNLGVNRFSISIKAENREKYKQLTKADKFDDVLKAIRNLLLLNAHVSASYVITEDNIDFVKEMVIKVKETGINNFFISFCRNYNQNPVDKSFVYNNNPVVISNKFEELLPWLEDNIEHLSYSINDPLCIYTKDFLNKYFKKIFFPCYVHTNDSLVFDTEGNLIPCNTIHQIAVGKIGVDFSNFDEYKNFINTDKFIALYKQLNGYPDNKCKNCKLYINCRGRCVCNWTNYDFEFLNKLKLIDKRFESNYESYEFKHYYLNKIIQEIENVDVTNIETSESKYKFIIGCNGYKKYSNYYFNDSLYKKLSNGNVAFFTSNLDYTSSLINVLTLLFCSYDISIAVINYCKKKNIINKLVKYLKIKKYILLNMEDIKNANSLGDVVNIAESIIVCGYKGFYCKSGLVNEFNLLKAKCKNIPSLNIIHPSGNNTFTNYSIDIYLYHDNQSKGIKTYGNKKLSLISYIL